MTDTMMAFLAMMLMMFFSLSQNESIVLSQKEAASVELEVLAHGAVGETMQLIAQKDFDQRTQDGTVSRDNQNLSSLTPSDEFPSGQYLDACSAIECFHQMRADTTFFPVAKDDAGNEIGFSFVMTAHVQYIDTDGDASDTQTWIKEVTLFVDQAVGEGETRFLARPVIKKQRFSPKW